MTFYEFLKVAHVVVFAVWFGTDLATFHLSRKVIDRSIEVPTRRVLAGAMLGVEVLARLCLPTMLALGLSLAIEGGYVGAASAWIAVIWVVTAGWVAMVWTIHLQSHRGQGGELAGRLAHVDLALRSLVCLGLWVAAVWSLAVDDGPFASSWLAAKVLLFALIMTCGIAIRFLLRPFSAAFGRLVSDGSNDETESTMAAAIRRAQPLVAVIWFSLLSATVIGVLQRLPWE